MKIEEFTEHSNFINSDDIDTTEILQTKHNGTPTSPFYFLSLGYFTWREAVALSLRTIHTSKSGKLQEDSVIEYAVRKGEHSKDDVRDALDF